MSSDEWYTPKWIFDALDLDFDLDVASSNDNNISVRAKQRYTIEDNGLNQFWFGLVWMNPPYSKPSPWVDKFLEHGNGIALLPLSKSKWFGRIWNSQSTITLLPPNLAFQRPNERPKQIFMQCCLIAISDIASNAISKIGKIR